MKTIVATSVMTALLIISIGTQAQNQGEDYLGLPGDNLNLYAVMKLFQESQTLEEFERNLNDENSRINNLDLNGDNQIDYISVFDNVHGNVHNIVLQVAINAREKQDVAVFTVERDDNGNIWLQLTGDEALYGKNYIIEPVFGNAAETPNPGYIGNATTVNGRSVVAVNTVNPTVVTVTAWPIVTYIYSPRYVVWRSPWYWGYYPPYWRTWSPYYWHYYYGYHYNWYPRYYSYYHRTYYHRHDYWQTYYYRPVRTYSVVVTRNISSGHYKATYSRPDQRSRGEALYLSTYENNNRRQASVATTSTNRRNTAATTNSRTTVNNASSANRRDASSATTATATRQANNTASANRRNDAISTQRSASSMNSTSASERRSVQSSSSTNTSSNVRSSSARASQPAAGTSTQARSAERTATPRTRTESTSSSSSKSSSGSAETKSSTGETNRTSRR